MNFNYIARNKQGRSESGILDAADAVDAYNQLRDLGLYPHHIQPTRTSLKDKIAMKLFKTFLTTNLGWISRKLTEVLTIGVGSIAAYAISKGIPDEVVSSGNTFLIAVVGYGVSLVMSKLADHANKEATPPTK
jgi:hypothetical protein